MHSYFDRNDHYQRLIQYRLIIYLMEYAFIKIFLISFLQKNYLEELNYDLDLYFLQKIILKKTNFSYFNHLNCYFLDQFKVEDNPVYVLIFFNHVLVFN